MAERADDPRSPAPTFTEQEDHLEARIAATESYTGVLSQVREMVRHCLDRKPSHLLVDMSLLRLKPSTLERYEMGMLAAEVAPHVKRVAVLARPEFIDPQKFGAQVANNRGLAIDIFSDRAAALAWLRSS